MDETKKASAALAAEKEVPRAVLDGILTIEADSKVESMEEQEDARWHTLLNAHRTRKRRKRTLLCFLHGFVKGQMVSVSVLALCW